MQRGRHRRLRPGPHHDAQQDQQRVVVVGVQQGGQHGQHRQEPRRLRGLQRPHLLHDPEGAPARGGVGRPRLQRGLLDRPERLHGGPVLQLAAAIHTVLPRRDYLCQREPAGGHRLRRRQQHRAQRRGVDVGAALQHHGPHHGQRHLVPLRHGLSRVGRAPGHARRRGERAEPARAGRGHRDGLGARVRRQAQDHAAAQLPQRRRELRLQVHQQHLRAEDQVGQGQVLHRRRLLHHVRQEVAQVHRAHDWRRRQLRPGPGCVLRGQDEARRAALPPRHAAGGQPPRRRRA
mmetsp:Transcript_52002/g.135794  ORF Transcript_52002/g.135794 Transcript_52002/m.135794 type:complete len:290 (-) Transcript_52002:3782-4651(-)